MIVRSGLAHLGIKRRGNYKCSWARYQNKSRPVIAKGHIEFRSIRAHWSFFENLNDRDLSRGDGYTS